MSGETTPINPRDTRTKRRLKQRWVGRKKEQASTVWIRKVMAVKKAIGDNEKRRRARNEVNEPAQKRKRTSVLRCVDFFLQIHGDGGRGKAGSGKGKKIV